MLAMLRRRLTFANVVSMLALFVALAGTAYASHLVSSRDIKNRSIRGIDVGRNRLTGLEIRESKLRDGPGRLVYVHGPRVRDASGNAESTARCLRGMKVIGGGAETGALDVPITSRAVSPSAWHVRSQTRYEGSDPAVRTSTAQAFAICARARGTSASERSPFIQR